MNASHSNRAIPASRCNRPLIARAVSLALMGAALTIPSLAWAQKSPTERIDELERKLEQSLKQIEQLSTEVSHLRIAKPAPAADVNERVTQQAAKIEDLERQIEQINESSSRGLKLGGVPLHGFADIGAGASRQSPVEYLSDRAQGVQCRELQSVSDAGVRRARQEPGGTAVRG